MRHFVQHDACVWAMVRRMDGLEPQRGSEPGRRAATQLELEGIVSNYEEERGHLTALDGLGSAGPVGEGGGTPQPLAVSICASPPESSSPSAGPPAEARAHYSTSS